MEEIAKLAGELGKIKSPDSAGGGALPEVARALAHQMALTDQLARDLEELNRLTKIVSDASSTLGDAPAALKKLEADGDKLEAMIREILMNYQKIAAQAKQADVIKELAVLMKFV